MFVAGLTVLGANATLPRQAYEVTYFENWDANNPDHDVRWQAFECIEQARIEGALILIRQLGGVASMRSASGDSILHDAASEGQVELLVGLLQQTTSEQVEARDFQGRTPLAHAVWEGQVDAVHALLDAAADPNLESCGATPILDAIFSNHPDVVDALLARGADPNRRDEEHNDFCRCAKP